MQTPGCGNLWESQAGRTVGTNAGGRHCVMHPISHFPPTPPHPCPSTPPHPVPVPQDCAYFAGARCEQSERYAGLWQVPLLELEQGGGQLVAVMDPGQQAEGSLGYGANVTGGLTADELEALLRSNFDYRCGWSGGKGVRGWVGWCRGGSTCGENHGSPHPPPPFPAATRATGPPLACTSTHPGSTRTPLRAPTASWSTRWSWTACTP